MAERAELVRKRSAIKAKLTRFTDFVNELIATRDAENTVSQADTLQLRKRLEDTNPILSQFEDLQLEIEGHTAGEHLEAESQTMREFESKFYRVVSLAEDFLQNSTNSTQQVVGSIHSGSNSIVSSTSAAHGANVKLPTIKLPTFDGRPDEWLNFRDLFSSLIDVSEELTDVQKLHYLRASLTGKASEAIKGLTISSANYSIAWNGLNDRYNNSRALRFYHIKELFSLETVSRESSTKLRNLVDSLKRNLRSLDSLMDQEEQREAILIHLLQSRLDSTTNREFENQVSQVALDKAPTLDELIKFVEKKASLLETVEQRPLKSAQSSTTKVFASTAGGCPMCNGSHALYSCNQFKRLEVGERLSKAKKNRVCLNCLTKGHFSKECKSKFACFTCKAKHHSLLHVESNNQFEVPLEQAESNITAFTSNRRGVLLPTIAVQVYDSSGSACQVKALLDSGSMSSFVSCRLKDRLKLAVIPTNVKVKGISNALTCATSRCELVIHSNTTGFRIKTTCLVVPNLVGELPSAPVCLGQWEIPRNLKLADPSFSVPSEIDILLGADYFWQVLRPKQICIGKNRPVLQDTHFGWVVSGTVPFVKERSTSLLCNFTTASIDDSLQRFWQIEEVPVSSKLLSKEEVDCETQFRDSVTRDDTGRFVVSVPLKESPKALGDSFEQAKRRFYNLEKRLLSNSSLRDRYVTFMSEYEKLGHMSVVSDPKSSDVSFYLPHHGVLKESSLTTKLRVVFDGSARTSTGVSLNDIQMIGPVVQSDLFSILVRFRKYVYVFSTDIEKMYRQVLITEEQRPLQRIVWRPNIERPLRVYELNTVTYGTASASFLATRCLHQVGIECASSDPELSKVIQRDFYVDDCLSGSDSLSDAQETCENLIRTLSAYGFPLRKWLSNDPRVLERVEPSDVHPSLYDFGSHANTLGLLWSNSSDQLLFSISERMASTATKRTILSEISQIFDPLGLLSPCVMVGKFMLQALWLEKISWDDPVPSLVREEWLSFRSMLPELNKMRFSRNVICENPTSVTLHAFSDASMKGYGACIYVRSVGPDGKIVCNLLCSKGRVAPLKFVSIPRMELCGALILTRLVRQVVLALDMKIDGLFFWTDSTIVLSWLKMPPNRLKTFVANRTSEIQELSRDACWRHIPGKTNPADLISRGAQPLELMGSELWAHGPEWLSLTESHWPSSKFDTSELPELECEVRVNAAVEETDASLISRFSNLSRLRRTIAYCLRFRRNCSKPKCDRRVGAFTLLELNAAMQTLVRISQGDSFAHEFNSLKADLPLKSSRLAALNPFIDQDGLIRVGGRIRNSSYSFEKKHPVIIDGKHPLARLIVTSEHLRLLHAGPQLLLASIRERYWITSGRTLTKQVVHSCVRCFRFSPKVLKPIMGDLPACRAQPSFPFEHTGVDYAGPFLLKDRKGRGSKISKCYVCLFVCLATKAIHLEIVSDLSSEVFIQSLRRFVSRRGRPSQIYSDNGTNFVGAKSMLLELGKFLKKNEDEISSFAAENAMHWHFIPGHSPHFGGLWEAGVKSCKHHLKRVVGSASLTFEEFGTLLTQIESILNSRPLTPLSSDPSDLQPLTPGHFLIGRAPTSVPDADVTHLPESKLSRFQFIQRLTQHFWARWSREYVGELQQRSKWRQHGADLKLGALVLIKHDNLPPVKWQLGRVIQLHPGKDGVHRVATIQTTTTILRRSFAKICPLPVETSVQ